MGGVLGEIGDLVGVEEVGEMGEYVPTCQVSQSLMAEEIWEMGDERGRVKVGGFWEAGWALGTQREQNQTLALTELRHTHGLSSVSELEEEGGRDGGRQEEGER